MLVEPQETVASWKVIIEFHNGKHFFVEREGNL